MTTFDITRDVIMKVYFEECQYKYLHFTETFHKKKISNKRDKIWRIWDGHFLIFHEILSYLQHLFVSFICNCSQKSFKQKLLLLSNFPCTRTLANETVAWVLRTFLRIDTLEIVRNIKLCEINFSNKQTQYLQFKPLKHTVTSWN